MPDRDSHEDEAAERWPPPGTVAEADDAMPDWGVVLKRGVFGVCPRCGAAPIFDGYLKVHATCASCGAAFGNLPADDAPPYIALVIVLQILAVFVVCFLKGYYRPGMMMSVFFLILLTLICMGTLRLAKGAVIGILLKLGMTREVLNG